MKAGVKTIEDLRNLDKDIVENLTGVPKEQLRRRVIIFNPTRNSMQSGVKVGGNNHFFEDLVTHNKNWNPPLSLSHKFFDIIENSRKHINGICNSNEVQITGKVR